METFKRYLISSIDTFFASFIPAFFISLPVDGNINSDLVLAAILASSVVAIRAVIKSIREQILA